MSHLELEVSQDHRVPDNAVLTLAAYIYQHTVAPPKNPLHEDRMVAHSLQRLRNFNEAAGIHPSRSQFLRLLILASRDAREACDEDGVAIEVPPRFAELDEDVWQYVAPYFEINN